MSSVKRSASIASRSKFGNSGASRPVDDRVVWQPIDVLVQNPRNSRRHPREQIHKLAQAIKKIGIFVPILIDDDRIILAGHGRLQAARYLEMSEVPTLTVSGLSESEKRAFVIADNRMAEMARWDREALKLELRELVVLDIDIELTGFDTGQVDIMLDGHHSEEPEMNPDATADGSETVTIPGDLWQLGPHRIFCGDATAASSYVTLLEGRRASMVFTDPPYNVPIAGHVSGLGKVRHREFAMASGEMSSQRFTRFLGTIFGHLADHSSRASLHYVCMDWRHVYEVLSAGREVYSDLKNICVWNKDNAGMGSLYRSKHEFVFVFQNGAGKFTNNIRLGATGRYRTNVWDYPGMTSMSKSRMNDLALHPTVKPIALVADAIRDCSKRGGLILDPFSGSGTTILAAQRTGRVGAAIEIDPAYVDVALKRWESVTGEVAVHAQTGETFMAMTMKRKASRPLRANVGTTRVRHEEE